MALYPYTITAIAKNTNEGSNIVPGAMVSLLDSDGNAAIMYDDAAGSNGSTGKVADNRGQVTVYVEYGEYSLNVNGVANGKFIVSSGVADFRFDNVAEMKSNSIAAGNTVNLNRYYADGDLVEGLVYEIQSSGTADGYIDHVLANGTIAILNINGRIWIDQAGATPDGSDQSARIQACLDLGVPVLAPAGKYSLSQPIALKTGGASFQGFGTYNTELEWIGADSSLNMVEFLSGRRDQGNDSLTVTNLRLTNFKISTKTGSNINNLIWIEAGCFHSWVEKIRGFDIRGGVPSEAIMKLDSNGGQSYPLGMIFRDIVLTGGLNDDLVPVPIGIWIEGAIECLFESVKVYTTQIGWQMGTPVAADIRNVIDCTFLHCQSEIGDRGFADGNGRSMLFYQGRHLTFYGCKFMAGADFAGSTTQLPLRFSGADGFQNKSIVFDNCTIWGVERCQNAMLFDSNVNYQGVKFRSCEFYGYQGALMTLTGDDVPTLEFDNGCTYVLCESTLSDFDLESVDETEFTINNSNGLTQSLQGGNDTTQVRREEAVLLGYNADTQGIVFSAYKSSALQVQVRGYNQTGSNITVPDGYWYTRAIGTNNSRLQGCVTYNPPSLAAGASASTTVNVVGANLGDFVAVSFNQDNEDVNVFGYVSSQDTVTVYFVNRTSGVRDLPSGKIRVYIFDSPITSSASATYDPPSLGAGSGVTTTVTVNGASVGDIATFSFSLDQQGVVGYAWVSAANTVSVRLQNESGGVVDLASGTLRVGVIETPRSI